MMVPLKRISTVLGLLAATATVSQAQVMAPSANQATANAVADSLRSSQTLAGQRIEIETRSGVVTLSGVVASMALKSEAIGRTQQVRGVTKIIDQLQVADSRVQAVQYQVAFGPKRNSGYPGGGDVIYDGSAMGGMTPGAMSGMTPGAMGGTTPGAMGDMTSGAMGGPVPEGPAGGPSGAQGAQGGAPGSPNYAWPSYAPYPNFSAVGYPTVYPWQAWPNIGPPYPYPEVPLDWRAVTLRWDDGIWWLDFKKHYTRPFFTPYPFGIFAY
jgi:hypothetical protein